MILDVQVWLKASACHKSCLLHQVQALRYPRMLFVQGLALNHDSKPVSRTTQSANQSRQNRQLHGDCSQPHLHPLAMLLGDVRLPEQLYFSCKPMYWIERKLRHPASRTKPKQHCSNPLRSNRAPRWSFCVYPWKTDFWGGDLLHKRSLFMIYDVGVGKSIKSPYDNQRSAYRVFVL